MMDLLLCESPAAGVRSCRVDSAGLMLFSNQTRNKKATAALNGRKAACPVGDGQQAGRGL